MFNIQTLNKISPQGLNLLDKSKYTISDNCENPDAILLRSYKMHGMELPTSVKAIGRAGAGTNNIPVDEYTKKGIVVFNTPGGNANAVKELVLAGLLLSSRDIVDGINWVKTLDGQENIAKTVESGKSEFAGNEVFGKKIGIIGLGAIGVLVANSVSNLGMKVMGSDPYISVTSAWHLHPSVNKIDDLNDLCDCDFISLHIPLTDSTKGMINAEFLSKLKDGVKILNFSRGELVNNSDLIENIKSGKVAKYVTDFPSEDIINQENIIAIPHLGASTEESEDNCAKMAATEVSDYLEFGNITNSVNFPNCTLSYTGKKRITIAHKNVPNVISSVLDFISKEGLNIENMINKSKNDLAYTIIDINGDLSENTIKDLSALENIILVREI